MNRCFNIISANKMHLHGGSVLLDHQNGNIDPGGAFSLMKVSCSAWLVSPACSRFNRLWKKTLAMLWNSRDTAASRKNIQTIRNQKFFRSRFKPLDLVFHVWFITNWMFSWIQLTSRTKEDHVWRRPGAVSQNPHVLLGFLGWTFSSVRCQTKTRRKDNWQTMSL